VEFVIVGGVSAVVHGSVMATYDLDICYNRSAANLRQLARALAPFHPRPRGIATALPFIWDERTLSNGTVFTLETDVGGIDLLAEVAGVGAFFEVKQRSVIGRAFGLELAVLDLPGLIAAKRAAGRPKDLAALPELESLLETRDS
jgi:hypothetical protein